MNDDGGNNNGIEDNHGQDGHTIPQNDSSRSECCPICFCGVGEDNDDQGNKPMLVRGRCNHEFCIPCIERVLTVPSPISLRGNGRDIGDNGYNSEDDHLSAPTLGRCPICRAEMSLFDLTTTKHGETNEMSRAAFQKDYDIQKSPLQGMVFIEKNSRQGSESLHFPQSTIDGSPAVESRNQEGDASMATSPLPYIDLSNAKGSSNATYWKFDNGEPVPDKMEFQPGCHYYHPTRTFHGTILWDQVIKSTDDNGNGTGFPACHGGDDSNKASCTLFHGWRQWDFILGFSSDLRWIARGIRVSRGPDGKVLNVVHFGPDDVRKRQYHRHFGSPSGGGIDSNSVIHNYRKAVHYPETLVGNIFVQALTVGLASYHFVNDTGTRTDGGNALAAYISYEHEQVAQWPPLDNGTPVPSRVWFSNTSFDATTRTFRGTIDWEGTYHTTWQGDRSWRYAQHELYMEHSIYYFVVR